MNIKFFLLYLIYICILSLYGFVLGLIRFVMVASKKSAPCIFNIQNFIMSSTQSGTHQHHLCGLYDRSRCVVCYVYHPHALWCLWNSLHWNNKYLSPLRIIPIEIDKKQGKTFRTPFQNRMKYSLILSTYSRLEKCLGETEPSLSTGSSP